MNGHKGTTPVSRCDPPFSCSECDFTAGDISAVEYHQETVHKDSQTNSTGGEMPYACSECGFSAMDNFALEHHMKSNHNGSQTDSKDYVIINSKSKISFKCSKCRYRTRRKDYIEIHMIKHNVPKSYKCNEKSCEFTGNTKQELDIHTSENHITYANMIRKHGTQIPNKNPSVSPSPSNIGNNKGHYGVKNRKHQNIGSNSSSAISVGPRLHMAKVFATKYSTETTEAEVKAELDEMLRIRTGKIYWVTVTKVETYFKTYNSFLITCRVPDTKVFMDKNIWPNGVVYDWYKPYRSKYFPDNGSRTNKY